MAYKATVIADWFIARAAEDEVFLTQMKLQKLVYLAHGWYLAVYGQPLITERVEAWQWGPVIRSIYSSFARYGAEEIYIVPSKPFIRKKQESEVLERVWNQYGAYSASQLSAMTHEDGPWAEVFEEGTKRPISDESISRHFRTLALET